MTLQADQNFTQRNSPSAAVRRTRVGLATEAVVAAYLNDISPKPDRSARPRPASAPARHRRPQTLLAGSGRRPGSARGEFAARRALANA